MRRKILLLCILLLLVSIMFVERLEDFEQIFHVQLADAEGNHSIIVKLVFYFGTYLLNAFGSIAFLHLWFQERNVTRAAIYLYGFGLFIWIPLFILMVQLWHVSGFEFLAHGYQIIRKPLFLFVLTAIFYFAKKKKYI